MTITPPEVDEVADEVSRFPLGLELDDEAVRLIRDVGRAELLELGIETVFNISTGRVAGFLAEYSGMRIVGVDQVTRSHIRRELGKGVAAGEDIRRMSRRLTKVFTQADRARARMIARTEVNSAAQFARYEAWQQSGVVEGVEWLTTMDGKARGPAQNHNSLHRQRRKMREPFISSKGHTALYPGGFGVASEDINCRCALKPVIIQVDAIDPLGTGRRGTTEAFDSRVAKWEIRYREQARKGFRRQRRAAHKRLVQLDQD